MQLPPARQLLSSCCRTSTSHLADPLHLPLLAQLLQKRQLLGWAMSQVRHPETLNLYLLGAVVVVKAVSAGMRNAPLKPLHMAKSLQYPTSQTNAMCAQP